MRKLFFLFLLSTLVSTVMQAQITWNFNSNVAAAGAPVNITGSNITQGNNNGGTTFRNNGLPASFGYAGASAAQNGNCSAKPGVLNITATGSTYVQTILTPATNFWINITGIKWGNFSLANTGPSTLSVYASNDNFATSTLIATATVTYSTTTWTLVNPSVTAFTGIINTAVTVRIFASGGTLTTPAPGAANWRIDDLVITATALTGSVGQIPKYTGPTTFGNSIITENSENIGIGTTTPAQKLDVAGGIKFSGLLVTSQVSNPAGTTGQFLQSNGSINPPTWVNLPVSPVSSWNLSGNALAPASPSFLGTTTNNDLVFKVNNIESGRLGAANSNTSFGVNAANSNTGNFTTAIGNMAASGNTNDYVTALGSGAANSNTGFLVTASGNNAAYANTGNIVTATGVAAAFGNTGSNVTATGVSAAGTNNSGNNVTATGFSAAAANTGNEVTANGAGSGQNNTGNNLTATGSLSASTNTGVDVTASGYKAAFSNTNNNITAIGAYATVTVDNAISLGSINGINGATADVNVGIGTTAPSEKLHIQNGKIRMVDGTQGAGKVLTSDANGVASWADAPAPPSTGWSLLGNTGTNPVNNFIGTTDENDLVFRVNNTEGGRINFANSNTSLGYNSAENITGVGITALGAGAAINSTGNNVTATGSDAGTGNTSDNLTATGVGAAQGNTGNYVTSTGTSSAVNNTGNNVTVNGYLSAFGNTGNRVTATGVNAAKNNSGNDLEANGVNAAENNSGSYTTASGNYALRNNTGADVSGFGFNAASNNTGGFVTAVGSAAAYLNTGNRVTGVGESAAGNNNGSEVTAVGSGTLVENNGNSATAIGAGAAQGNIGNEITISGYNAASQNTGNNLTANGAWSANNNIGNNATAIGYKAAIGNTKNNITAIGAYATVTIDNAISLGGVNGINGATADVNVGIGTTAPSEKLHIQNGSIRIVDGTQGAGKVLTSDANGVASWQTAAFGKTSVSADNGLAITGSNIGLGSALNQATAITNNGFGLTIKGSKAATTFSSDGNLFSSGKIAIGTTDLAQIGNYSLAVNGAAIFTKASVKLIGNWPDYVFEPTYKLTALSEVEKFITEHKHLPGVASAAEIQKNGIDLGENQAILLKKVEELTLYTIEANKKIEQQQAQINLLLKQHQAMLEVQQQKNK